MEIIRVGFIDGENGCENSPVEILRTLKDVKSNSFGEKIDFDSLRLEEIHVNLDDIEESEYLIFENSKEIFEKNFKAFFIGGDHSISYLIIRAFEKVQDNPLIIVFDAHGDCLEEGSGNRNWLRRLIKKGFDGRKIILISGRNFFEEEIEFLKAEGVTLIKMEVLEEDLIGVCDLVMERAKDSGGFYVSIDIDSVDPAYAPATNELEPGGMSSRDLIYFIGRLKLLKNFRGADIVEINPKLDLNGITVKLGARLLGEMI